MKPFGVIIQCCWRSRQQVPPVGPSGAITGFVLG
jgi:hypothetical protein